MNAQTPRTPREYWVEFNDRVVSIDCQIVEACEHIEALFKDLLVDKDTKLPEQKTTAQNTQPLLKQYSVCRDENDLGLIIKNQESIVHTQTNANTVEVANELMNVIKLDLLTPIENSLVLHAGLVSYAGKSILLPGNSGNGKSLTTLGLLSLGCEYHSDEVVLHNPTDDSITPFVRPLMIKPHGIEAARALIGKQLDEFIIQGETINSLPVESLHKYFGTQLSSNSRNDPDSHYSLHKPPPIHVIVFPEYNADSEGEITHLSAAQTMMELFKNNVVARNLPDLGIASLKQLVQHASGLKLHYAGYTQLPTLFKEIQAVIRSR